MPTHAERRFVPFRPDQIYDLVADVKRYPEFLPWCIASRIRTETEDALVADLVIGFKMVREKFTSEVSLAPKDRIDVRYTDGPLRHLNNHWIFESAEGGCIIDFYVDFEFRSVFLQKIIGALFNEAVRRMVAAFEDRARELYEPLTPDGPAESAAIP